MRPIIRGSSALRLQAGMRGHHSLQLRLVTAGLPSRLYRAPVTTAPAATTSTGLVGRSVRARLAGHAGGFSCVPLRPKGRFFSTGKPSSLDKEPRSSSSFAVFLKGFGWVAVGLLAVAVGVRQSSNSATRPLPLSSSSVPDLDADVADSKMNATSGLSEEEVTKILGAEAFAHTPASVGVQRYHGARVASNGPVEDQFVHGKFSATQDGEKWFAWGVLDGHAGSQTSEFLRNKLVASVRNALNRLPPNSSEETVQATIKDAFVALDDAIIKGAVDAARSGTSFQDTVSKLVLGAAGSCALLSLFDPKTRTLRVACTGDSRAVLGQQGTDGEWVATPLSVDQSGKNEDEIARINAEHPGETDIVKDGRVLGIMCSRAFGDGRWKWDVEFQHECAKKFGVVKPLPPNKYAIKTPPYLTAEPVITSTKVDSERPSFLILATDGLWDMVTNEQAVKLVADWLDWQAVDVSKRKKSTRDDSMYELERHSWGKPEWVFREERTSLQDDNVAVHLVRNALGGRFHEMISGGLTLSPPFSRGVRDDITVQVVFFDGKAPKTKQVDVK